MKEIRLRGSVTVFAAMSFMIIASVICAMIESARVQGARVMVAMAADMALDGLFSGYERELLDKYGILLFDGAGEGNEPDGGYIAAQLKEKIERNLNTDGELIFTKGNDFYGIEIDDVSVDNVIAAPDAYGLVWRRDVVDYAKLEYGTELIEGILGIEGLERENDAVMTAAEYLDDCMDEVSGFYASYLKLIEHVDGIRTESNGVNFNNLRTRAVYVKKIGPGGANEASQEALSINNYQIYQKVSDDRMNVYAMRDDFLTGFQAVMDGKTYEVKKVKELSSMIRDFFGSVRDELEIAMRLIDDIRGRRSLLEEGIAAAVNYLDSASELSVESLNGLNEELQEVVKEQEQIIKRLGDADAMYEVLKHNYELISAVEASCANIGLLEEWNSDGVELAGWYEGYKDAFDMLGGYRTDSMVLEYDGLECRTSDESVLGCIYDYTMNGLLGLILPKGAKVSEKKIANMQLADLYGKRGDRNEYIDDKTADLMNEALFNIYLGDYFECYTKNDGKGLLDYEQEFILCGNDSDRKNLEGAIIRTAGIRFGCNMTYILTDAAKKQEAYNIALAALGFTGIIALVKALEYVILTAWAMGETVVDMKILLRGGKIPVMKDKEDWRLDIQGLIHGVLDAEEKENERGLDYSGYLSCLMMLKAPQEKAFRSMAVVEMHMMSAGVEDFRLKGYVYGLDITVTYHIGGRKETYTEHCSYTY